MSSSNQDDQETTSWAFFGSPVRGRSCGSCKACCTQVPVDLGDELKAANVPCKHLCSRGCSIYARRPQPCRYWSCRWLFDEKTAALRRPDLSGYIVDAMPDTIVVNGTPVNCVQIWCDPKRPDAHLDPALRAYIDQLGRDHGTAAIIRWGSDGDAFVLAPPSVTGTGKWFAGHSQLRTKAEVTEAVRAAGGAEPIRLEGGYR